LLSHGAGVVLFATRIMPLLLILLVWVVILPLVWLLPSTCCCSEFPLLAVEPFKQRCEGSHPTVQVVRCLM
jgi:hypothetical protein